jgi:hypothetical protein
MNCPRCALYGKTVSMDGPHEAVLEQCQNGTIRAEQWVCFSCGTIETKPVHTDLAVSDGSGTTEP